MTACDFYKISYDLGCLKQLSQFLWKIHTKAKILLKGKMSSFGEASITQNAVLSSTIVSQKITPYALAFRTCVYAVIRSIYIESKNICIGINVNLHSIVLIIFCETAFI